MSLTRPTPLTIIPSDSFGWLIRSDPWTIDGVPIQFQTLGYAVTAHIFPPDCPDATVKVAAGNDDGVLEYKSASDDFNTVGRWRIRLYAAIAGENLSTELGVIEVEAPGG